MLFVLYYALGILALYGQAAFSNPTTTYDQRQTGDLNVQIHVKDLQVIALLNTELLEDYTDYDYAYDYADFTLKPIVKPTSSPISTSSVKPWNTWPTNPSTSSTTPSSPSNIEVDSSIPKNDTEDSSSTPSTISSDLDGQEKANDTANPSEIPSANNETTIKLRINDKSGNELFNDAKVEKNEEEEKGIAISETGSTKKKCPAGYAMSQKGRCRAIHSRRRFSLVPLTMKLGPRLSQKDRLSVRKDLPIRVYKSETQP